MKLKDLIYKMNDCVEIKIYHTFTCWGCLLDEPNDTFDTCENLHCKEGEPDWDCPYLIKDKKETVKDFEGFSHEVPVKLGDRVVKSIGVNDKYKRKRKIGSYISIEVKD
jgi:hypothetical protein